MASGPIIVDKETGEVLLPNETWIGPQTSLAQWFANSFALDCRYFVNDDVGSVRRRPGGGPQAKTLASLIEDPQWHWVWFGTPAFTRGDYRISVQPSFVGGALRSIGIFAQQEWRAAQEQAQPKEWPEYSAEDEQAQWSILRHDLGLGEPNTEQNSVRREGILAAERGQGYAFAWGTAKVAPEPHLEATKIMLQYRL